jgi:hypothetical protein
MNLNHMQIFAAMVVFRTEMNIIEMNHSIFYLICVNIREITQINVGTMHLMNLHIPFTACSKYLKQAYNDESVSAVQIPWETNHN